MSIKNIKKLFFDRKVISTLILLNAIIIFVQEFNAVLPYFNLLDNLFTILFSIEIFLKIRDYTFEKYIASKWNRLDFIVVSLSFIALIFNFIYVGDNISIEFIISLRILRIFKSFRLIKFVPNIRSIINGVNNAMKTTSVIILTFIILLFIVSIFTCSIFKNVAPEYFANPLLSVYSIFRIFSVEGWYEIPDLIAERSNVIVAFLSKLYFVVILFFGGILGMSLINSIFVDAMVSDNNEELEKQIERLNDKIDELTNEIRTKKTEE